MRVRKLAATAAAALLLCSGQSNAQQSLFGDFGVPAWSRMYKYFESRFGGLAKDEVALILPIATNAAWDDPNSVMRMVEMQKWGDWMPSNAWQYSANANKRISEGYRYFLNAAFIAALDANGAASPALKNAVKRSNEELQFNRADYNQAVVDADATYEAYAKATPLHSRKSKADFFKDQKLDVEIAARKKRLDDSADRFKVLAGAIVDPDIDLLTRAKVAYDNPNQQVLLPPVREVLADKDRWQTYFTSWIDKDIFKFLSETVIQNQSIVEASAKSDFFEQRWSANVSVSFLGLFRAGGASAEQVKREQHIRNNTTKINISFDNLDVFSIVRGQWFNQNLIDRFAGKLSLDMYTAIWGPNGQLEVIPKALLVGRNVCFDIYADSLAIDYMYEHFSASADAGFFISYWRIGGGADYSSTKEQTSVKKFTDRLSVCDLSGRPKVLGVVAKQYALSLPKPAGAPLPFAITPEMLLRARKEINTDLAVKPNLTEALRGVIDPRALREITK